MVLHELKYSSVNRLPCFYFTDNTFVLCNARVIGYPIVYANEGFCKITGYNRADIMQKSGTLKDMYGEATDVETCQKISKAFDQQDMLQIELLIFKKTSRLYELFDN